MGFCLEVSELDLKLLSSSIAVEDLNLKAVESLKGVGYIAIGKHLCGPATGNWNFCNWHIALKIWLFHWSNFGPDVTLRCCIRQHSNENAGAQSQATEASCYLRGLAIATCCHHLCQWKNYISNHQNYHFVLCVNNVDISEFLNYFNLQIRDTYLKWVSPRKISMRFHGLPAGQLMQIMAQTFLSQIALRNLRSCNACYSFASPFVLVLMA